MMRRAVFGLFLMVGIGHGVAFAADEPAACSLPVVEINPDAVIEPCSKIIAENTTSPADRGYALFIRGKGYHSTKRFDLARQDYDIAIGLTPENEELFVSRANIAFRGQRYEEGVSFLQRALALNPSNGHALRTMGALFENSGRRDEANRHYARALAADPKDAYALLFRSKNNISLRQLDEALKDADELVAMAPADINRQGYLDRKGDRLDFHIVALENRATVYDTRRQFDLAEQDLDAAVAYRRSALSLAARGKFLAYKNGREKAALSDLDEAIALGSVDSDAFYAKGVLHMHSRETQGALAAFDGALKIDPHFGSALRMRAAVYRQLDQTDLAVADIIHAMTVSPSARRITLEAVSRAGYWRSSELPTELTPALEDAIRACMLDKLCS
jgi:tetratricopeptide (TPR) repeat protein